MKLIQTVNKQKLYGAIIGDIAGSCYEFSANKNYDCELFPKGCSFTDDTILTAATAMAILLENDFALMYKTWGRNYPHPKGGYGASFSQWLFSDSMVGYNSLGNGAAMRVSPCAYVSKNINEVLDCAARSAVATHSHWQGVRAAQAVARCIYLLNHGYGTCPEDVIADLRAEFMYDFPSLEADYETQQDLYSYSERAEETVPMAIWCALSATSFEDAVRRAIALGGDADTLGAITGSIAECIFEIPADMIKVANKLLDNRIIKTIQNFNEIYVK